MKQELVIKNAYSTAFTNKDTFEFFYQYPRLLVFEDVINKILMNSNENVISEEKLYEILFDKYGSSDEIAGNSNNYSTEFTETSQGFYLIIKPNANNQETLFKGTTEINYQKTGREIPLDKNTFK